MEKLYKNLKQLLENYCLCDNCLGRTVAQLLHGIDNKERGKTIRYFFGFLVDSNEAKIKNCNLAVIPLRNEKEVRQEKCYVCGGLLEKINEMAKKVVNEINKSNIKFSTFLVGCKLPGIILKRDEEIRKIVGIEYSESIKREINREIGKIIESETKKKFSSKKPELEILIDFRKNKITLKPRSVFIVGYYEKLKRGIPQAKWILEDGTKKRRTSIQEIIEKVIVKHFRAAGIRLSAAGREDVDVRCLDWRPMVIEVLQPKLRNIDLKTLENEINKSSFIKVKLERYGERRDTSKIKEERHDKTYRAIVVFEEPIEKEKLKKIKQLKGEIILQKTPTRVLHRRTDLLRKRRVKSISYKILGKNKIELTIKAEAGLYIKELIHGDNGRTKPNIAELIKNKVKSIKLDVIKIHRII
ncbi:MAG: tRNA pseudouridine(54/55) synthase Pus10 [Candidatus Aenigmarchaeota archaeon]|nr:tRNA pseudouridine(54/55) synthase Pus10 [Candidatus Aenigmarchaeota archaeon]